MLSGEKPPRVWSQPVVLRDVVRAAIAETEDLDRVAFEIPEGRRRRRVGHRPHPPAGRADRERGAVLPAGHGRHDPRAARPRGGRGANAHGRGLGRRHGARPTWRPRTPCWPTRPRSTWRCSKRLGFHVVARLAARHGIRVVLSPRPAPGSPRRSPCPARCSNWGPSRSARWFPPGPLRPLVRAGGCRVVGPTSPQPPGRSPPAAAGQPARRGAGAAFDRAAFDRAAFDRAGFGRTADGVRVDRPGMRPVRVRRRGSRSRDDSGADVRALIPGPRMPLPSETGVLGPEEPAERGAPSWTGWRAGTRSRRYGLRGSGHRIGRGDGDPRDVDRSGATHHWRRAAGRRPRRHARPCAGACRRPTWPRACASSRRPPSPPIPLRCRSPPRRSPVPGEPRGRPVGRRRRGGGRAEHR